MEGLGLVGGPLRQTLNENTLKLNDATHLDHPNAALLVEKNQLELARRRRFTNYANSMVSVFFLHFNTVERAFLKKFLSSTALQHATMK